MTATRSLTGVLASSIVLLAAAPLNAEEGWIQNRTVVALVNTSNGGFNIRLSPDLTACVSQSGYGPNYASVYPSHAGLNRIKADMITALTTGKPVSLYLAPNCVVSETILGPHF